MKTEKMKVLLYLKKSGLDRSGKAQIMGRITIGRSIAQFSCKLSCNPDLWNPRESRMDGKSREAVEVNGRLENLLLSIQPAYQSTSILYSQSVSEAVLHLYPCFGVLTVHLELTFVGMEIIVASGEFDLVV